MVQIGNLHFENTPIFLAPMEDVSDTSFRMICKELGADVVISEFASADALIRNIRQTEQKLSFCQRERPFGIQLFGNEAGSMCEAARIAQEYNPDFIDINWGCPVKKIAGKGAGAGMLQNLPLLIAITKEVVRSVKTPVTVKTRTGWDETNKPIVELAEQLQDVGVSAISIHGRTRSMMYKGEADWTLIGKIKENPRMRIPVIGNGDVDTAQKALQVKERYRVDGIMIGRASVGNPWIFSAVKSLLEKNMILASPSIEERLAVCKRHFDMTLQDKGEHYGILTMRKHYKNYFRELENFKQTRIKLLTTSCAEEIVSLFQSIEKQYIKQER
ncbi:MAG: tRNA dihydrouridine synthase DusB [Bacteroidales bacterium]|jgi:nifR3 family TIM-barrel protein|nr:tRNA dihydrouridine synthase DusB [Bacteroidales bacterium]